MEQKFKNFLAKYNNQFVEVVDPTNWAQCFDLVIKWCEKLGLPTNVFSGLLNAYQIWEPSTVIAMNNFIRVPNTPDAIPQTGDIIVWAKSFNGTAGHTGIATGWFSDTTKFQCFEQNDPTGSNSHLKDYNYNSVIGWLRFKGDFGQVADDYKKKMMAYNVYYEYPERVIEDIEKYKKLETELRATIDSLEKEVNTLEKKYELLQNEMETRLAKADLDCQDKIKDTITRLTKDFELKETEFKKTISDLETELKDRPTIIKESEKPKTLKGKLEATLNIWF